MHLGAAGSENERRNINPSVPSPLVRYGSPGVNASELPNGMCMDADRFLLVFQTHSSEKQEVHSGAHEAGPAQVC